MQYHLVTPDLITLLYFCDHPEKGFKLSSSVGDAKIVAGRQEALTEAGRLRKESGMKVEIMKVEIKVS